MKTANNSPVFGLMAKTAPNDKASGVQFNPSANSRATQSIENFLTELFV